ncbi:hypothetical protein [uncultured Microbulbifer sp.]|nr:hypothetical protein [uncultured Microbulbifer sp.]
MIGAQCDEDRQLDMGIAVDRSGDSGGKGRGFDAPNAAIGRQ